MLLVLVMVLQWMPIAGFGAEINDIATGNKGGVLGFDTSTFNKEGAINWPIKIYDFLNDGMLFEYANVLTEEIDDSTSSDVAGGAAYGGGEKMPVTVIGTDYTVAAAYSEQAYKNHAAKNRGTYYTLTPMAATAWKEPRHLRVTAGTGDNMNIEVSDFYDDNNKSMDPDAVRYMTIVYRSSGTSNDVLRFWSQNSYNGAYLKGVDMPALQDSAEFTYRVIDLREALGASAFDNAYAFMGVWLRLEGLSGSDKLDLTHVAYFDNENEAKNYGKAAAAFSNKPGEDLNVATTIGGGTYPTVSKPDYLFSLRKDYQGAAGSDALENVGNYGLDFTAKTIYFDATNSGWSNVNVYAWNDAGAVTGEWPGTAMKKVRGNIYSFNVPANATKIIFNNGSAQTSDLTIPTDTKNQYGYSAGKWDTYYTTGLSSSTYKTWATGTTVTFPYGSNNRTFDMDAISVSKKTEKNGASYVRLTTSGASQILLTTFREESGNTDAPEAADVNYAVLVYRGNNMTSQRYAFWTQGYDASGSGYYAGIVDSDEWLASPYTKSKAFEITAGTWTYAVVPLDDTVGAADSDAYNIDYLKRVGLYLPTLSGGTSLDLAYVAYFGSNSAAESFGSNAAGYMNSGLTGGGTVIADRGWNMGNNQGFGMLFASSGGHWGDFSGGYRENTTAGGSNPDPNGYYSWMLGYNTTYGPSSVYNTYRQDIYGNKYTAKYTNSSEITLSGVNGSSDPNSSNYSNFIYYVYAGVSDDGSGSDEYDTSVLEFDGYNLLEVVTDGLMTAGLLEGTLGEGRLPVYRQETVEYIAYTLYNALPIPQKDAKGNYNYNFIAGAPSKQYAGYDLNRDGKIGMADLNGDGYMETDENSCDLATALRYCLGVYFTPGQNRGSYPTLGDYATTSAKGSQLMGKFQDVRGNINTCMDAAYYLLNNIFVDNSYNQLQDDYGYLTLSGVTMDDGNFAYIFDAGFTTGQKGQETTSGYKENSQSAVQYSPYEIVNNNGQISFGGGTISLENVNSKDLYYYMGNSVTTRFPFIPVTNAEGDYAGESSSYYFCDDGIRVYKDEFGTYQGRNYNYVLASNGEFVYREADDLFFQFEGDDDVYLFINGQIVLDIGAAHSITSVGIDVNEYVHQARKAMAELEQYGYYAGMPNSAFDAMIDGANLTKYTFNSDGEVIGQTTVKNPYTAEQKTMLKRYHRLNLVEGQICQFDFFYMERHGNGANMRIVTNMHITDPTLGVEKGAEQFGEEIEYGGVVDASSSMEYNFKLSNTGNTKLYNLTFSDDTIGIKLDYTNGLTVDSKMNGLYVLDKDGEKLDASDLYAIVRGYKPAKNGKYAKNNATGEYVAVTDPTMGTHNYVENTVYFDNNEELIAFLHKLEGEGMESSTTSEEITQAGSGLWVDASVQFKGIHYILTPAQVEAGFIHNTVYVTATTRQDPMTPGNETLRSDASHRAYTSGAAVYYQWADHDLFLKEQKLLDDATLEAGVPDSQLNQYYAFFNKVNGDTSRIWSKLCDKTGRVMKYPEITVQDDGAGNAGFMLNYPEEGKHNFYVLMYLNEDSRNVDANGKHIGYDSNASVSEMELGSYAIVRVTIYSADVNDSYFVMDYGLKTESLDTNGELFKDDYLFGYAGGMEAKLMGVANKVPTYRSALELKLNGKTHVDYNRITFESLNLTQNNKLTPYVNGGDADGYFNVNMAISSLGKPITYDSYTGKHSLVDPGTVTITAEVPVDSNWEKVSLYYWYDNGVNNGWPGTAMTYVSPGRYQLDIPGDVTHVIVNNGSTALQTQDLSIAAGIASTIKISVVNNKVSATVESAVKEVDAHVKVPDDWGKTYLYYMFDDNTTDVAWPGVELTEKDANGYYLAQIPGAASYVCINNGDGNGKQSYDLDINAGHTVWLVVNTEAKETNNGVSYYDTEVVYSQDRYTVKAKVPASWGDNVYLYYWYSGSTSNPVSWPGITMEKGADGWYTLDVSDGIKDMIITDGESQTLDLMVQAGIETWITVNEDQLEDKGEWKHTATIHYGDDSSNTGLFFSPTDFVNNEQSIWLAITVHATGFRPTKLVGDTISNSNGLNINKEVQMFKKVTVLPANVVYYEDDFNGIHYSSGIINSFTHHGSGSVVLSQSVDQNQPYGQDASYQDEINDNYSGESLTKVKIRNTDQVASFTFAGTGFEIIGRTNAKDSASMVVRLYDAATYSATAEPDRVLPVITQFDNSNNGGNEGIEQVPVLRVNDLELGEYVVEISGMPTFDFDNWDGKSAPAVVDTYLYLDGVRIFQPIGDIHEAYTKPENGAEFNEIRDLITEGLVGVVEMEDGKLTMSSGTTTWTEDLLDGELSGYVGNKVNSTNDYLIQGPNNEVYMEGGITDSAVVFYVSENTKYTTHELQIAVRGVDQAMFYGNKAQGVSAQLQYGVKNGSGYDWRNLAPINSGTEQYYSIPYTQCPVDANGNYQIMIRAVSTTSGKPVMVSYSTIKTLGLSINKVEGNGQSSLLYFSDGLLVSPTYSIFGSIDGKVVTSTANPTADLVFNGSYLEISFTKTSFIAIRRVLGGKSDVFMANGTVPTNQTSATMYNINNLTGTKGMLTVPAGHTVTLRLLQTDMDSLTLSYELKHDWDEGRVVRKATCTEDGQMVYTCTTCGTIETKGIPATGHTFVGGYCVNCREPDPSTAPRIIYFRSGNGWGHPNVYTWVNGGGELTGNWPGSSMTQLSAGLFFYVIPGQAEYVIFNDGFGQTGDMQLPDDGSDLYILEEDRWITYNPNCTHATHSVNGYCDGCGIYVEHSYSNGACVGCGKSDPTFAGYYLVGYINGADYGCEGDWENLGIYRFENGSLVATFEQDSYVFIKTGDNNNWYMTQAYVPDSTGTFYHTSTGSSEKMYVPGGVEVHFTMTVNADGSLTLSYVMAASEMDNRLALNLDTIRLQMTAAPTVETVKPQISLDHPSLSFEDEIRYNVYYSVSELTDVTEMGLITFDSKQTDGTVADALEVIPGYTGNGELFMSATNGIAPKNMGDTLYFKVYAKLSDGSYVYSDVAGYNAVAYANTVLKGDDENAKALVTAMLNYGAAAQEYFGYNTDSLMNAGLTAGEFDSSMISDVVKADSSKLGAFTATAGGFSKAYPTVSFEGAFAINYYFTPAESVDNGMTLYYWDAATYASATELTADNATGTVEMSGEGQYWGAVSGIAAKQLDETIYVAGVYTSEGETHCTGVIAYSLGCYLASVAADDTSDAQALAQAAAIYGSCAKNYFA